MDKNKAVIDYLLQCDDIKNSALYFNLIDAKNNSMQILTTAEDKSLNRAYIDGSILKRYTFTLITFKSISDIEIVKPIGTDDTIYPNENVDELYEVQSLIDWIQEQNDIGNYPDFGENCVVDSIDTSTNTPKYEGISTQVNPPLAMYSISIVIEYLDTSKVIFN